MTVGELIDRLKKFDIDAEVIMDTCSDWQHTTINNVFFEEGDDAVIISAAEERKDDD